MKVVVFGAGVQGTLYGVRLARSGHDVTFVARGRRVAELRSQGAVIEDALTGRRDVMHLAVTEALSPDSDADLCLVTIRREQIEEVLPGLARASGIPRIVFMVNHANGSEFLITALGRRRVVLAFPGVAGSIENGVDRYVEVAEQPTTVETAAPDVAAMFRRAGFRVDRVRDMDSWLRRHAVFVTAVSGALYEADGDARRLASETERIRAFILAVREGWTALDVRGVSPAPLTLRAIICWVPLMFAILYWRKLLNSPRGEFYFARHARHAVSEMAALKADICALIPIDTLPHLQRLYAAIDQAAAPLTGLPRRSP